jgi:23S rRNA pseudouridine2605 synthase
MQKKRTDNFSKFAEKKKGSAIKESYRQEKRKVKADARAAGEEMRALKKAKARGEAIEPKKVEDKRIVGKNPERKKTPYQQKDFKKGPKKDTGVKNKFREGSEKVLDNETQDRDSLIPLNKFIAHAGVCGRREAAELVKGGKVTVNGDKIFEPGYKVTQADKVTVKGKAIFLQKNNVYILLNKPKDFITTANDPQGRKTVLDLIKGATLERVYPVGRLDRNTTGVLLLTNDGELAQKLTHPSFEVKKIYEVTLDKPVTKKDLDQIITGVTLEDGFVQADAVGYADTKSKNVVGIEIHSGRNRIVRRIFEHLGYDVKGLDRVMFANLTKKNVERSKWRILNEKEIRLLKFMNKSFIRKNKVAE